VLSSFYGSLKGCDAQLEKLFITGIGRMVRTSIFSELNQMKDVTLHPTAAEVCGYTESELHRDFAPFISRLAQANALKQEQAWLTLRHRYNGYWWGKGEKVYNPWAILNCMADNEFGSYWWASGTPGMLVDLAATIQRPDGDLEGVKATDLSLLFDITQPAAEPLLWQSGYLTVKAVSGQVYTLGFPNAEVREAWFSMMLGHFCGTNRSAGQTSAALMLDALRTGNRPQFEQALTALFATIPYDLHLNRGWRNHRRVPYRQGPRRCRDQDHQRHLRSRVQTWRCGGSPGPDQGAALLRALPHRSPPHHPAWCRRLRR
jgi:hypothetical protein